MISFRRILMIVLFLVTCTGFCFLSHETAQAKTYKIKSAADWKNIGKKSGGTFKLTKDIRLSSTKQYLTISKNKKYTIDFNGHKVTDNGTGSTHCPLAIRKGTVILKTSKKKGGVLYSKEWMTVTVSGKAKLYLKSGAIVNDTTEFRTGLASGIYLDGSAKCYLQGKGIVQSINNGVVMTGKSKLYLSGTPRIRGGYLQTNMDFTHYGSGILIYNSKNCTLSLKGGTVGTMATPDVSYGGLDYTMSGSYPILDTEGQCLKLASGYKYLDYGGNQLAIDGSAVDKLYQYIMKTTASSGLPGEKKVTTSVKDPEGFYTVFIIKG